MKILTLLEYVNSDKHHKGPSDTLLSRYENRNRNSVSN